MKVEIGAEAALFSEKEYIKWIFVAVWVKKKTVVRCMCHIRGESIGLN